MRAPENSAGRRWRRNKHGLSSVIIVIPSDRDQVVDRALIFRGRRSVELHSFAERRISTFGD